MNKWLAFVAATSEKHFGFLRDEFGFEIDIPKRSTTETAVTFSKPGARFVMLLFMMPIEGSAPWIVFRGLTSPPESTVSLDHLIKVRCPNRRLTATERRNEAAVWSRYSEVLQNQFADLLAGTIELSDIIRRQ